MKLSVEQEEAFQAVIRHHGFPFVVELLDEIQKRIESELLSVPIPADAEKAALVLLSKRMQAEGGKSMLNAFKNKIQAMKSERKERESNG
jgi:CHASE3 domain sensor protein